MKTQKLISKFFQSIINKDVKKEEKLYYKLLKKSLKGKDTKATD